MPVIHKTDLVIANIETVISDKNIYPSKKRGIFLKSPAISAKVLKDIGVDIALLANNHIDDYGEIGILDTVENLEKENILYFGLKDKNRVKVTSKGIDFEMMGVVTPYESDVYFSSYGKTINEISSISACPANEKVHFLYFLHGFDELYSTPFPWRVNLLKKICESYSPSALVCGHQHIYQGCIWHNTIPVCLSYGNGFLNIEYHKQNMDSTIGCYFVLWFDEMGCFRIDEYLYSITANGIIELSDNYDYSRIRKGIDSVNTNTIEKDWEQECFERYNKNKYNKNILVNILYDFYRFFRQRKSFKYIYYNSMFLSYIKLKYPCLYKVVNRMLCIDRLELNKQVMKDK